MTLFDWFDRSGRPLLRLFGVAIIVGAGSALVAALWFSALSGQPVPDMTGGLSTILVTIVPLAIDQWTRSQERRAQIAAGRDPGPFGPPPSPPYVAPYEGVNPHGGPNAP